MWICVFLIELEQKEEKVAHMCCTPGELPGAAAVLYVWPLSSTNVDLFLGKCLAQKHDDGKGKPFSFTSI